MNIVHRLDHLYADSSAGAHAPNQRRSPDSKLPPGSWIATLQPVRVLRDDLGRVAWIVTSSNEWFGVRYAIMAFNDVIEIIEPYLVWRKEGVFFFAYHSTLRTPILNDNQQHMSFAGKVFVNQQSGEIQIVLQSIC